MGAGSEAIAILPSLLIDRHDIYWNVLQRPREEECGRDPALKMGSIEAVRSPLSS